MSKENSVSHKISLVPGSLIAVIFSWALNHSVGWAIFHFFCGWLYVLYAALARSAEIIPALKVMFGG